MANAKQVRQRQPLIAPRNWGEREQFFLNELNRQLNEIYALLGKIQSTEIPDEYLTTDDIENDLTATEAGKVLDATQGKALNDKFGDYVAKTDVANDLTQTAEGKVLDARQGKALDDKCVELKGRLDVIESTNWSGQIGTDNQVVASGTNVKLGSLSLTKGSYILTFTIEWQSNATGLRTLWIAENSDTTSSLGIGCTNTVAAASGNVTRQQITVPYYASGNKTLYVCCNQNSGSNLTTKARYGKARIS